MPEFAPNEKQEALAALQKRSEFENSLVIKAYEDEEFRQNLLSDPKKIYAEELGTNIPDSVNIEVIEEQPNTIYIVLPRKVAQPDIEGELSDEALETVAGGASWLMYPSLNNNWLLGWR